MLDSVSPYQKFLGFVLAVVHILLWIKQDEAQQILVSGKLVKLADAANSLPPGGA